VKILLQAYQTFHRKNNFPQLDPNIVSTVFHFQHSREGHSSLTDLMFGMRQRETGMTKYPVRNRQRVITFAVTVALKEHNQK
jgi:hypothetical protein